MYVLTSYNLMLEFLLFTYSGVKKQNKTKTNKKLTQTKQKSKTHTHKQTNKKKLSKSSSFSHLSLLARQNFGQQAKVCCALPTAKRREPSTALGSQQRGKCFCVSGTPLSGSDSSLLWRKILTHFPGKRSGEWDSCRKKLPDKKNNKTRQRNNREKRKEESNYSPEIPHRGTGDITHNKIIIIMYICHAVADALSAHRTH